MVQGDLLAACRVSDGGEQLPDKLHGALYLDPHLSLLQKSWVFANSGLRGALGWFGDQSSDIRLVVNAKAVNPQGTAALCA